MRRPKFLTREQSRESESRPRLAGESWSVVRFETPMWTEDPAPTRLHAFVVFDEDGEVLAQEVIAPSEPPARVKAVIERALKSPLRGKVRKPGELRVEDDALVGPAEDALRFVAPDARVTKVPWVEDAEPFFAAMRDKFGARIPGETFAGTGASRALIEDYFRAMAELDACKPWDHADETQLVGLSIPALEVEDVAITILSEDKEGIMLMEGDDPSSGFDSALGRERRVFEHGMISAELVPLELAVTKMKLELRALSVVPDERRVPLPLTLGPDACARQLQKRDVVLLTAAAKAITRLIRGDADVFDEKSTREVTIDEDFRIGDETLRLRIDAPHRLHGWMTLEDPSADPVILEGERVEDALDYYDEQEEQEEAREKVNAAERAIIDAFLAAKEQAAEGEEWRARAEQIVTELCDYTRASEATFGQWTMGELERFVLTDLPEYVDEDKTLRLAPDVIVALARFLQKERVPRMDLQAIEKRMRKIRPRLDELLAARHTKLLA